MIFKRVASVLFKVKVGAGGVVSESVVVLVLPVLMAWLKTVNIYKLHVCVLTTARELHFTHSK